ncbi:MAG: hypothetical protein JXP34_04585 [Planctomycetes bacterium]|nr:hypothetical protein [Planctomycetota bacterium]
MRKACFLVLALSLLFASSGCFSLRHTVGNGPQTGVEQSQGAWYALWGLVPLGTPDGGKMAGNAADYEIHSRHTFWDYVISLFTGVVTVSKQTVTVTK